MTKDLDLSTLTNSEEILPQDRDHLEAEVNDIFLCAFGQNAITEMTKKVRERERTKLTTVTQTIHTIPVTFYPGKKRPT